MTIPTMTTNKARYVPTGLAAIAPQALGLEFALPPRSGPAFTLHEGAAVVTVCGPLVHQATPIPFATYDEIRAAVQEALASDASTVIMRINSPGGDVAGAFDCARGVRRDVAKAGKRLIAFTDGMACSAAYALASAASEIVCTDTAHVGSIGVIATMVDASAMDRAMGVKIVAITSGARKADGNPHVELTEDAIAAQQASVDEAAGVFFGLVASHRGSSLEAVAGLQAGTFTGRHAVTAGLADRIASWDEVLASAVESAAPTTGATQGEQGDKPVKDLSMPKLLSHSAPGALRASAESESDDDDKPKEDATRASLVTAAESDDPKKAARAKRALAAYDEENDESAESEEDEPQASATASAAAAAAAAPGMAALVATVQAQGRELASLKSAAAAKERADFLATRPDLSAEVINSLAALPLPQLKIAVNAIPKTAGNPLAPPAPRATVGAGQGGPLTAREQLAARPNPELDRIAGLTPTKRAVVRDGVVLHLGKIVEG
jgi:signal peptide peptidase SppA